MKAYRIARDMLVPVLAAMAWSVAACQVGAQTSYPGGVWEPGPAAYGSPVVDSVTVTMDDGIKLKASVAYPTDPATRERAEGPFPVIIEFTPYPWLRAPLSPIHYLTAHGYIYAVVRPRGTGGSEGELQQFSSRDGRDGKTVVDWAAHHLNGSEGRVVLLGCSYPGATALATAAFVGPDSPVKAVIAACIGFDMQHRQVWTTNGLPNAALTAYAPRATFIMGDLPSVSIYWQQFYEGVMAGGPEAYDGYWKDRLPLEWAQNIAENEIPVLLWSGWKDINEIGAIHAYSALQNAANGRPVYAPMAEDAPVNPRYQLIMGNWGHAQGLHPGVYLQWFETWLKGVDTGLQRTTTPMHLFEVGTERWINVAHFPLVEDYTEWYFAPGHELSTTQPEGNGEALLVWGPPEAQDGTLSFETPVFAEGTTLAGPISATVYARSSNTNMALIAKLYDVAPDGAITRVTMGALLGSQRALDPDWSWTDRHGTMIWPWPTLERDDYLTPGQIYRFDIPLASRQWGFAPGHRLRLELTTQSPSDVCPQNGAVSLVSEPCRLTVPQQETLPGGTYKILYGSGHPSTLNLPQLPWQAFPAVRAGTPPADWADGAQTSPEHGFTLPLDWGSDANDGKEDN